MLGDIAIFKLLLPVVVTPGKSSRGQCLYDHVPIMCQRVPMSALAPLRGCLQLLLPVNTNVRRYRLVSYQGRDDSLKTCPT